MGKNLKREGGESSRFPFKLVQKIESLSKSAILKNVECEIEISKNQECRISKDQECKIPVPWTLKCIFPHCSNLHNFWSNEDMKIFFCVNESWNIILWKNNIVVPQKATKTTLVQKCLFWWNCQKIYFWG